VPRRTFKGETLDFNSRFRKKRGSGFNRKDIVKESIIERGGKPLKGCCPDRSREKEGRIQCREKGKKKGCFNFLIIQMSEGGSLSSSRRFSSRKSYR